MKLKYHERRTRHKNFQRKTIKKYAHSDKTKKKKKNKQTN